VIQPSCRASARIANGFCSIRKDADFAAR
jgi:hypothetical protein